MATAFLSCLQVAHAGEPVDLGEIVVIGYRPSLATAQGIKRSKQEIVDAVAAGEIDKLPDINVSDALQRIPGVQILRDRGEGAGIAIRGLTQMETLFNGREVFTAGNGRNLDFADIAAEMLAGIDVYKTASAEHIEGGIGGLVDLRTRRPFDFEGREVVGSARVLHGDLVAAAKPQFSFLASDRWDAGVGEFGALVNVAWQKRAWREDQFGTGNPRALSLGADTVHAPNGATETVTLGERERLGASLVLQWRPNDRFDLYAEAHHAEFKTRQDGYQLFMTPSGGFDPGSVTLFPGSGDVRSIAWTNPTVSNWGSARDTVDRNSQFAVGGAWTGDALTLKTDLSYTDSHNNLFYSVITANGTAASLTQDVAVGGADLAGTSFDTAGMVYAGRPFDGELMAWRLDGEYRLDAGVLDTLSAGLRLARRDATNAPGQVVFWPATAPLTNAADLLVGNPYSDYPVGDPAAARDLGYVYDTLGIAAAIPTGNPLGAWTIREDTVSAHVMAGIKAKGLPLDGNAGLRLVGTREQVDGFRTDTVNGGVAPIAIDHDYVDVLPSLNLRYKVNTGLFLRAAASKTLTRPDFLQLSPSLILNPVQLNGSAGNPELRPIRADNLDFAVERYFNRTDSAHLTAFWKKVDGFVASVSNPETHDGVVYQVSRPRNTSDAQLHGIEVGYQGFFDFLPGWMSGLGAQANYTWVDSRTPSSLIGQDVPLQNLSEHSYNLIGLYERGRWSARVAWNWRDKYLGGIANIAGVGALPIYTRAYGWLDAALNWRWRDDVTVSLEGSNLLGAERHSYYGVETRPHTVWRNDRQIGLRIAVGLP